MATKSELIADVNSNYDVVSLIDRGLTGNTSLWEYDLFYRLAGSVKQDRLRIYLHDVNNPETCTAEWYLRNPIPSTPDQTFIEKVEAEIITILNGNSNIKYMAIDNHHSPTKRAIVVAYIDSGSGVEKREAYVWEDGNGDIQYALVPV